MRNHLLPKSTTLKLQPIIELNANMGGELIFRQINIHIFGYIFLLQSLVINDTKVNWLTIVKGALRTPFSIATTLRCRGRHHFFNWITPLTLDSYLIMLSVKQGSIKYHFLSLWYEPRSPRPLVNTLTNLLIGRSKITPNNIHFNCTIFVQK